MTSGVYFYIDKSRPAVIRPNMPEGEVFYVGKGQRTRAVSHLKRSHSKLLSRRIARMQREDKEIIVHFIECVDDELAILSEIEAIALIGRKDLGKGPLLNLTDGGDGVRGRRGWKLSEDHPFRKSFLGKKHTEESRKKMSDIKKGKVPPAVMLRKSYEGAGNPFFGKTHTVEARAKMTKALTGLELSIETKQRISRAMSGLKWWKQVETGKSIRASEAPDATWLRGRIISKEAK